MRKIILTPFVCSALLLSACSSEGDSKASGQVTQTRMDDIDKIEGTINDDMINVDESTDSAVLAKDDGSSDSATDSDAATKPVAGAAPASQNAPVE
jgi:protein involved in sex pheromone biosynthesis